MSSSPSTVTEALDLLAREGYTEDFNLRGGAAECPSCQGRHELGHSIIERQFRFEGPSDPGDEAIVLGLCCTFCGARGVLVSAFGPDAPPGLLNALP